MHQPSNIFDINLSPFGTTVKKDEKSNFRELSKISGVTRNKLSRLGHTHTKDDVKLLFHEAVQIADALNISLKKLGNLILPDKISILIPDTFEELQEKNRTLHRENKAMRTYLEKLNKDPEQIISKK